MKSLTTLFIGALMLVAGHAHCAPNDFVTAFANSSERAGTLVASAQSRKSGKPASTRRYFTRTTTFVNKESDSNQTVTYYPNGKCYCVGYILDDGDWVKGTADGRYYIQNNVIYVTWEECLDESYKLNGNQYMNGNSVYRMKK